jgi:hypothetical protein
MMMMKSRRFHFVATAAVIAATATFGLGSPARAQDRPDFRPHEPRGPHPGFHLDDRYHHDHYYPPRGYAVPVLPGGAIGVTFGSGNYFFHGGVWFRPYGGRYLVIAPPPGILVPVLPPAYVTPWIGGAPYYYANGVYYAAAPGQGYTVVVPPPGAEAAQPAPAPAPAAPAPKAPPDPIIYPRGGQTPAQTEADRQECNRWATTQPSALADAQIFQRAVAACMDGRGYTVR